MREGLYRVVKERETVPFKGELEEQKKKPEYYVNTGYAIRTLREEMPELFYRELSFDIYRFEHSSPLANLLVINCQRY